MMNTSGRIVPSTVALRPLFKEFWKIFKEYKWVQKSSLIKPYEFVDINKSKISIVIVMLTVKDS